MRSATGTASGWTSGYYEFLTIEFLKYGLRDIIADDWKNVSQNPKEGWYGHLRQTDRMLKIVPQNQIDA